MTKTKKQRNKAAVRIMRAMGMVPAETVSNPMCNNRNKFKQSQKHSKSMYVAATQTNSHQQTNING
jgi:hypothetical protein